MTTPGKLDILNISKGHLELTFDGTQPEAVETARKAITDMLARNYLIVITDAAGKEHKVTGFDPDRNCYIIKEIGGTTEVPITEALATAVAPAAGG